MADTTPDCGPLTRIMYQPLSYLHSSRRFHGFPAGTGCTLYDKIANAAILRFYRLPLNADIDLQTEMAQMLLNHWLQLPLACDYLGRFIHHAYKIYDDTDTPPDTVQQAFNSLSPVITLPDWPDAAPHNALTATSAITQTGTAAMQQLLSRFSPALGARLPLLMPADTTAPLCSLPCLPDSLLPLVFRYVPFTA